MMNPLTKQRSDHGGDIYSKSGIRLDLSANINPRPFPEALVRELPGLLEEARAYPDLEYRELRSLLFAYLSDIVGKKIPDRWIIPGNGASELLDKTIALRRKGLVLRPCFSEYEKSFLRYGIPCAAIDRGPASDGRLGHDIARRIKERIIKEQGDPFDALILCSPNNPDGAVWEKAQAEQLFDFCQKRRITVILDETFADYLEQDEMLLPLIMRFENLIAVRAMTKFFGLPGVRLGYAVTSDPAEAEAISSRLIEWNVGTFALGIARNLLPNKEFAESTRQDNRKARQRLYKELSAGQWFEKVYPSAANFLMVYSQQMPRILEQLASQGILLRDLANVPALGPGYARIAVKPGTEDILLEALGRIAP